MSKFESFEPQPRDLFRTSDPSAVVPLIPSIRWKNYAEPCVGEFAKLNEVASDKV